MRLSVKKFLGFLIYKVGVSHNGKAPTAKEGWITFLDDGI